jgi:hypothetical protein
MASYDLNHPVVKHLLSSDTGWSLGPDYQAGLVRYGRILFENELSILLGVDLEDIPLMLAAAPAEDMWYGIRIPAYYSELIVPILQLRLELEAT